MKTCSIDGCERKHYGHGWCNGHWKRWRKYGDPLGGGAKYTDPDEAFLARTEPIVGDPGCIIWTGATNSSGYGSLWANGKSVKAHRYSWERVHGPIPDDRVIDHTCYERSCVNPDHLRLATPAQNASNLRGARPGRDLPRGVTRDGRRYAATVNHNGVRRHLGMFDSPEAASIAASNYRNIVFGEYAGRA